MDFEKIMENQKRIREIKKNYEKEIIEKIVNEKVQSILADNEKTAKIDSLNAHKQLGETVQNYFKENLININASQVLEEVDKPEKNPYNFVFDAVSEEDILKAAVIAGVPVFIHGRTSEGKSARVKQLDPNCTVIYLRNATPDFLNGKSVYNEKDGSIKNIEPNWFKNAEIKANKNPNKIHIVFFDELTNALASLQGMAFNIILEKEVNGTWKLSDNCRIVAAGNEMEDSLAANQMAEPMFNRFAHVYITTTLQNWLKWAVSADKKVETLDYFKDNFERKIHPAIYSFIAFRGEQVLRTPFNGTTPNADPRKWEMASKLLYATKNPNMLRCLVGSEVANEFVTFCKQKVVTLEDILKNNYDNSAFEMSVASKIATAAAASYVDEENFSKVRSFVKKLGKEYAKTFDVLWMQADEKRLETIKDVYEVDNLEEAGQVLQKKM